MFTVGAKDKSKPQKNLLIKASKVSKLSRRLEALASAVNQLNQNSNAAIGNKLKAEVGHFLI